MTSMPPAADGLSPTKDEVMTQDRNKNQAAEADISAPRLTPQSRADPSGKGEDSTDPRGEDAKKGQGDKAEG
jgi:hypothetical protein